VSCKHLLQIFCANLYKNPNGCLPFKACMLSAFSISHKNQNYSSNDTRSFFLHLKFLIFFVSQNKSCFHFAVSVLNFFM
jgi:hypothetical protein